MSNGIDGFHRRLPPSSASSAPPCNTSPQWNSPRNSTPPRILAAEIASLRAAGYDIEEHPHLGCRLISAPDRIIADDLTGMLDGVTLARKILVFEKTGSTNDLVASMGRSGEPHGLVIFAEEQTAGRGRLGRRWESDSHRGLWFSLLLRPRFPHASWTRLTTWAAVAIAEALETASGCHTAIKWPNDIYIDGKKVTGILIESHFNKSQEPFAVLGIGVNVNHDHFPPDLAGKAASLKLAAGHPSTARKSPPPSSGNSTHSTRNWKPASVKPSPLPTGAAILPVNGFKPLLVRPLRKASLGVWTTRRPRLRLADGTETTLSTGEVTLIIR